jgi:hypothetical protein
MTNLLDSGVEKVGLMSLFRFFRLIRTYCNGPRTLLKTRHTQRRRVLGISAAAASALARSKTLLSMLRVSLPVLVFCSEG